MGSRGEADQGDIIRRDQRGGETKHLNEGAGTEPFKTRPVKPMKTKEEQPR